MATIRERVWAGADGVDRRAWQCDFVDQSGKRRHRHFRRRKDADAFMVAARGQVAAGTYTPDSATATVADATALWLQRAKAEGLERGTIEHYHQLADHIRAVLPAETRLAPIGQARCEQLRDDLLSRHSRAMARKVLASFKAILKDAKRRGLVAQNVAAETVIGTGKRHQRRLEVGRDVPTPAEVKALIEAAGPKARALVCLAALAGLRASELRGLRWSDVELGVKPAVTIAQRADRFSQIGSPKSVSSRRTLPLSATAVLALKEWQLAQPPGRPLVFGTRTGKPATLVYLHERVLLPLVEKAGVRWYGWHAFRHYAISSWLATGIDPKTAQHWAGHGKLVLTLDTYGHLIPRTDDHARINAAETLLATNLQHGRAGHEKN
jgi:integrase